MTTHPFLGRVCLSGGGPLVGLLRPALARRLRLTDDRFCACGCGPAEAADALAAGDLLIDLTRPTDPGPLLEVCHDRGVMYLSGPRRPGEGSCYDLYTGVRDRARRWPHPRGATAVLEHGAAPGLLSHLAKRAVVGYARAVLAGPTAADRRWSMEAARVGGDYPRLARLAGVCGMHLIAPAGPACRPGPTEVGWGTHEATLPPGGGLPDGGPRNQLCLPDADRSVRVRSWLPGGEVLVRAVGRADAFTVSDHFTEWDAGRAVYRPTVVAAQAAAAALGVLLIGPGGPVWWAGFRDVPDEAERDAAGLVAAAAWVVRHPLRGLRVPDDLPADDALAEAAAYLGEVESVPAGGPPPGWPAGDSQFVSLMA